MRGSNSFNGESKAPPPRPSELSAPLTLTANRLPCVSTRMCRFLPQIFFPPIVALLGTAHRAGFDRLTVDDRCTGLFVSALFSAHLHAQRVQELLPDAFALPSAKVGIDGAPGGKLMGQHPPGAPPAQNVED